MQIVSVGPMPEAPPYPEQTLIQLIASKSLQNSEDFEDFEDFEELLAEKDREIARLTRLLKEQKRKNKQADEVIYNLKHRAAHELPEGELLDELEIITDLVAEFEDSPSKVVESAKQFLAEHTPVHRLSERELSDALEILANLVAEFEDSPSLTVRAAKRFLTDLGVI